MKEDNLDTLDSVRLLESLDRIAEAVEKLAADSGASTRDEILDKKQLSKYLRVTPRFIESQKDIPTLRLGRAVRYNLREVLEHFSNKGGSK